MGALLLASRSAGARWGVDDPDQAHVPSPAKRDWRCSVARYSRLVLAAAFLYSGVSAATAQCCGDCDADGAVTISELVHAVTTALTECRPEPDPRIVLGEVALTGFAATL